MATNKTTKRIDKLTKAQEARFSEWRDKWMRTQAMAIQYDRARHGSDCFPNPGHALSVLSKLLGANRDHT